MSEKHKETTQRDERSKPYHELPEQNEQKDKQIQPIHNRSLACLQRESGTHRHNHNTNK